MRIGDVLELGDSRVELYCEPSHEFTETPACICKIIPNGYPEGVLGAPISALLREIRHRVESYPCRYGINIVD